MYLAVQNGGGKVISEGDSKSCAAQWSFIFSLMAE